MDEEAAQLMAYQTSSFATECCSGDIPRRLSVKNAATEWSFETNKVGSVPDYDLAKAIETTGCLIDTHFHLDFISRRLGWKVKVIDGA